MKGKELLQALKMPFPAHDIEWRVQTGGKKQNGDIWAQVLAYVTNRAIMERLDEVVGPENWKNEYQKAPDGGVMCGLSIRIDNEWITKWDGAENTDIEGVKGGLSNSMKRAGVQWGIGRYLYRLDASFVNADPNGTQRGQLPQKKGGDYFRWNVPQLPDWALTSVARATEPPPPPDPEAADKARCMAAQKKLSYDAAKMRELRGSLSYKAFADKLEEEVRGREIEAELAPDEQAIMDQATKNVQKKPGEPVEPDQPEIF